MFYVHTCNPKAENSLLAEYKNEREAFRMARELLGPDGFDTYVSDTSKGHSEIIGFGSTGKLEPAGDNSDPCTRGGSVLFGRETE